MASHCSAAWAWIDPPCAVNQAPTFSLPAAANPGSVGPNPWALLVPLGAGRFWKHLWRCSTREVAGAVPAATSSSLAWQVQGWGSPAVLEGCCVTEVGQMWKHHGLTLVHLARPFHGCKDKCLSTWSRPTLKYHCPKGPKVATPPVLQQVAVWGSLCRASTS